MPYPFDAISAIDPDNTERVASSATVTLFAPGDVARAPIAITDLAGSPLPNPLTVDAQGFGPSFMADIDIVAWTSGEYEGLFQSPKGIRDEATAAKTAAATSATAAATSATSASTAATAAATSATSATTAQAAATALAAGVVRSVNGLMPDSTGAVTVAAGGGGGTGNVLVLGVGADVPVGTPAWTVIVRASGAPGTPAAPALEIITASMTSVRGTAVNSLSVPVPAGVQNNDLLLCFLTHQQPKGTGMPAAPAGWTTLHALPNLPPLDNRHTAVYSLPVTSSGTVASSYIFDVSSTSGRYVAAMVRVTGANLGGPLAGVSGQGTTASSTVMTTPAATASAGSLALAVFNAQVTSPSAATPTSLSDGAFIKILDLATSEDPATSRTSISIWAKILTTSGIPSVTLTWPAAAAARGGMSLAIAKAV